MPDTAYGRDIRTHWQKRAEAAETALSAAYEALTADDLSPLVTQEAVENARIAIAEALIEVAPKGDEAK